jgi:hypothetical protein
MQKTFDKQRVFMDNTLAFMRMEEKWVNTIAVKSGTAEIADKKRGKPPKDGPKRSEKKGPNVPEQYHGGLHILQDSGWSGPSPHCIGN